MATRVTMPSPVERVDGYAPIRDYAAIGDGRTVALVARDGAVEWLCLPDLDSPAVFASLVDASRGGRFTLEPAIPFEAARRYLPQTNVLETTFATAEGSVRVTDAMTLPTRSLAPYRELARRVEPVSGKVPMQWSVQPRFGYAQTEARWTGGPGVAVAQAGRDAVAVRAWDAGEESLDRGSVDGRFEATEGRSALIVVSVAHQEPAVLPGRVDAEERLDATARAWREWASGRTYDGPWRDAVIRSALALKLLVYAPSGAIAAAATTSLPEEIGGERNWDYRYSWPRDAAFALEALLALGCGAEARAFFFWLLHASQLTRPRVQVLYRLDGSSRADERTLPLSGYRDSAPVRIGNGAAGQTQLDVYGELFGAAARFAEAEGGLDRDHASRLVGMADLVCRIWAERDSGIWEVRAAPEHFTQSKMMCAVALGHACDLAARGVIPADHADRWRAESERVRKFVETRCFSERRRSYARTAGGDDLDASLLLGVLRRYDDARAPRLVATVDAIRDELARGALVYRYRGGDGVPGEDGAFVACSFWLAEAYALQGRLEEAEELMDELVGLANDVGLYAEEIDPETGEFLGNFPQALTHLALVNAAVAIARGRGGEP